MADSRDMAANLHRRLNTYGAGGAPGSLTASLPRRPGAMAQLEPLPSAGVLTPALRKRIKPDASSASLHDPTSPQSKPNRLGSTSSKATLAVGTELLTKSTPMPFAKIRRKEPQSPVMLEDRAADEAAAANAPVEHAHTSDGAGEKRDPFWFIRMLRTELSDHEFAYMNVSNTEGTTWDPYDLTIVAFNEVDPNDHYTISEAGVTHCTKGKAKGEATVAEFTPLEQWESEAGLFHEVTRKQAR